MTDGGADNKKNMLDKTVPIPGPGSTGGTRGPGERKDPTDEADAPTFIGERLRPETSVPDPVDIDMESDPERTVNVPPDERAPQRVDPPPPPAAMAARPAPAAASFDDDVAHRAVDSRPARQPTQVIVRSPKKAAPAQVPAMDGPSPSSVFASKDSVGDIPAPRQSRSDRPDTKKLNPEPAFDISESERAEPDEPTRAKDPDEFADGIVPAAPDEPTRAKPMNADEVESQDTAPRPMVTGSHSVEVRDWPSLPDGQNQGVGDPLAPAERMTEAMDAFDPRTANASSAMAAEDAPVDVTPPLQQQPGRAQPRGAQAVDADEDTRLRAPRQKAGAPGALLAAIALMALLVVAALSVIVAWRWKVVELAFLDDVLAPLAPAPPTAPEGAPPSAAAESAPPSAAASATAAPDSAAIAPASAAPSVPPPSAAVVAVESAPPPPSVAPPPSAVVVEKVAPDPPPKSAPPVALVEKTAPESGARPYAFVKPREGFGAFVDKSGSGVAGAAQFLARGARASLGGEKTLKGTGVGVRGELRRVEFAKVDGKLTASAECSLVVTDARGPHVTLAASARAVDEGKLGRDKLVREVAEVCGKSLELDLKAAVAHAQK